MPKSLRLVGWGLVYASRPSKLAFIINQLIYS